MEEIFYLMFRYKAGFISLPVGSIVSVKLKLPITPTSQTDFMFPHKTVQCVKVVFKNEFSRFIIFS